MAARYGVRVWLALVTVYLVWGSTFIALAITIRDLPPFLAMSVRHLIAGTVLLVFALPRGDRSGDRIGRRQIVAGFIFGGLLFVTCVVAKVPLMKMVKELWPFLWAQLAVLAMLSLVPQISTWLPNLMGYK